MVNLPAVAVPHIHLKLTFIATVLFRKFAKPWKLPVFELADILKAVAVKLAKTVRLTVPDLSLIPTAICVVQTALAGSTAVFPFAYVDIATFKVFSSLSILFAIFKVTCVHIPCLVGQNSKAVSKPSLPLSFVSISVFMNQSAIALF